MRVLYSIFIIGIFITGCGSSAGGNENSRANNESNSSGYSRENNSSVAKKKIEKVANISIKRGKSVDLNSIIKEEENQEQIPEYEIVEEPKHGKLIDNRYEANKNYFGEDRIVYSINGVKKVLIIEIQNSNDKFVAYPKTVVVTQNKEDIIRLEAIDFRASEITFEIVKEPEHGKITVNEDKAIYTPNPNYKGRDSFQYQAKDKRRGADIVKVDIYVKESQLTQGDTTTKMADKIGVKKNAPTTLKLTSSDLQGYIITEYPKHANIIQAVPNPIYEPDKDFTGEDSFSYKLVTNDKETKEKRVEVYVTPFHEVEYKHYKNVDANKTKLTMHRVYKYNIEGKKIYSAWDDDADGVFEWEAFTTYAKEGDNIIAHGRSINRDKNRTSYSTYVYDANGNNIKSAYDATCNLDPCFITNERQYDKYGNVTHITKRVKYKYDNHTEESESFYYYRYDEYGNLLEDDSHYYSYDKNNRVISKTATGNEFDKTNYDYSHDGRLIKEDSISTTIEGVYRHTTTTYKYNDDGKLLVKDHQETKYNSYHNNYDHEYRIETIQYDGKGRKIFESTKFKNVEDISNRWYVKTKEKTYQYNDAENRFMIDYKTTRVDVGDTNTTTSHHYLYGRVYDKYGNIIRYEGYDPKSGKLLSYSISEYE